MPKYQVETIEAEWRKYCWEVEADSKDEAIKKAKHGEGDCYDNEFICTADELNPEIGEVTEVIPFGEQVANILRQEKK